MRPVTGNNDPKKRTPNIKKAAGSKEARWLCWGSTEHRPYITGKTSLLLPLTTKQDPSEPTPTQKTTIKSRYNTKRTYLKALESEEKADRFWRKTAVRWIPNQSGEQGDRNTVLLAEEIRILKHRNHCLWARRKAIPEGKEPEKRYSNSVYLHL